MTRCLGTKNIWYVMYMRDFHCAKVVIVYGLGACGSISILVGYELGSWYLRPCRLWSMKNHSISNARCRDRFDLTKPLSHSL